ncbi:hypothetical protein RRG08_012989 [Elysia crispata]|uniref:Uncharacterized protein n=1 Tax=Elysia crispata TaxID=231223 RepID=A0AAE1A0L0_9GAST|nr:hypothetical protein RRG08_012989 [Elysia crispata]
MEQGQRGRLSWVTRVLQQKVKSAPSRCRQNMRIFARPHCIRKTEHKTKPSDTHITDWRQARRQLCYGVNIKPVAADTNTGHYVGGEL